MHIWEKGTYIIQDKGYLQTSETQAAATAERWKDNMISFTLRRGTKAVGF